MATGRVMRLVFLAIAVSRAVAQSPSESTVVLGPSGTCPVPVEETVSVQPVVYSAYFAGNTEIDPFGDGHTYTINNAPTVFVVNTVLVTTIYHNGTTSVLPNGNGPTPTNSQPSTSGQPSGGNVLSASLSSLAGLTSAAIPTRTSSTSAQAQSSIPPLRLGDGIPSGNVTDLSDTPIVLGFIDITGLPAGRAVQARDLRGRQVAPNPVQTAIQTAVSAAQATATANWIVSGSSQPVGCNVATPYTLVAGKLINNGTAVGKYNGSTTAVFGELLSGNANPIVDTGFAFINGILSWQAPDVGIAVFYSCGGTLYAAFDPTSLLGDALAPYNNCNQVALGGIASASCQAHLTAVALQSASSPSNIMPLSSLSLNSFPSGDLPTGTDSDGGINLPTSFFGSLPSGPILSSTSSLSFLPFNMPSGFVTSVMSSQLHYPSSILSFVEHSSMSSSSVASSASSVTPNRFSATIPHTTLVSFESSHASALGPLSSPTMAGPFGSSLSSSQTLSTTSAGASWFGTSVSLTPLLSTSPTVVVLFGSNVSSNQEFSSRFVASTTPGPGLGLTQAFSSSSLPPQTSTSDTLLIESSTSSEASPVSSPSLLFSSGPSSPGFSIWFASISLRTASTVESTSSPLPPTSIIVTLNTVSQPYSLTSAFLYPTPTSTAVPYRSSISSSMQSSPMIAPLSQSSSVLADSTLLSPSGSMTSGPLTVLYTSTALSASLDTPTASVTSTSVPSVLFASSLAYISTSSVWVSSTWLLTTISVPSSGFISITTTPFSLSALPSITIPSEGIPTLAPSSPTSGPSLTSTMIYPSPTGPLCVGEGAGMPVASGVPENNTIGTYNYQIIQQGNLAYEIECYADFGSCTPLIPQYPEGVQNLEACIDNCNAANAGSSSVLCQAVTFYQSSNTCLLCNSMTTSPTFNAIARSARLVFAAYPIITDAFYLLPTTTSASLGLCTSSAFAYDIISPQNSAGNENYYENECGRYFRGIVSSVVSAANLALLANSLGPGEIAPGLTTTDECMKLCDLANHLGPSGGIPGVTRCRVYLFDTVRGNCTLYGDTDGVLITDPTINAGRLLTSGYPTPTDRPLVTGYTSGFQYVNMTTPPTSSSLGSLSFTGIGIPSLSIRLSPSLPTSAVPTISTIAIAGPILLTQSTYGSGTPVLPTLATPTFGPQLSLTFGTPSLALPSLPTVGTPVISTPSSLGLGLSSSPSFVGPSLNAPSLPSIGSLPPLSLAMPSLSLPNLGTPSSPIIGTPSFPGLWTLSLPNIGTLSLPSISGTSLPNLPILQIPSLASFASGPSTLGTLVSPPSNPLQPTFSPPTAGSVPPLSFQSLSVASSSLPPFPPLSILFVSTPSILITLISGLPVPATSVSSFSIPSLPPLSIPSLSIASISIPPLSVPPLSIPSIPLPSNLGSSLPSSNAFSISNPPFPSLSIPSLSISAFSIPSTPVITIPPISIPSVSIQSISAISVPSVSIPSFSIPSIPPISVPPISILSGSLPSIPNLSIPSVSVPSVTIPSIPPTSVPSISIPPVSIPSIPSISVPSNSIPPISIPSIPPISVPSVSIPSLSIPSLSVPVISIPSLSIPSLSVPTISIPSLSIPLLSMPAISIPSLSVPAITIPSISIPPAPTASPPSVTIPSFSLPGVSIPSFNLPTFSTSILGGVSSSIVINIPLPSNSGLSLSAPSIPIISIPTISVPSLLQPSLSIPSLSLPTITIPSLSVPTITIPSLTLPTVTIPSLSLPSNSIPSLSIPNIPNPFGSSSSPPSSTASSAANCAAIPNSHLDPVLGCQCNVGFVANPATGQCVSMVASSSGASLNTFSSTVSSAVSSQSPITCGLNAALNPVANVCVCNLSFVLNASTGQCVCPASNQVISLGVCTCPLGKTLNLAGLLCV